MNFDVIVIGSGFGGAITGCRLAEAGFKVLILERGRRWDNTTYPREPTDNWIWNHDSPEKENGWVDFRTFPNMAVAQGAAVAQHLSRGAADVNFYDIGANTGQHSLFMSSKASSVQAFEPSAVMCARFESNMRLNAISNVHLHCVGLGDTDEVGVLGSGFPGNPGSRSLNWSLPDADTESVRVRRSDDYFSENALPPMSLMKLDVEGHERKVLRGMRERLHADRPIIMMELVGSPTNKGGFSSDLDFRSVLYPNHEVRSLIERRNRYRLVDFDWNKECAVIFPVERSDLMSAVAADRASSW